MRISGNVGNLPHLRCWRTGKRTLTEPLESLRPTEMSCFTQSIHFDHFWTRLYSEALTSLTRDSPRCRLPRVEIFPVPMKRDEVSSKAEISAIRFSFCAKVVQNRIEKRKQEEERRGKGISRNLLLHPVEEISPLPTKSLQGSARVSVAASLSSHLTIHHQT